QIEMVEKLPSGGEHCRTPRHFAVADHTYPLTLQQRLDDLAVDRDATDIFDLATSDWLAIGDQRQSFQQGPRITLRPLFPKPPDPGRKARTHLQAIATGDFL